MIYRKKGWEKLWESFLDEAGTEDSWGYLQKKPMSSSEVQSAGPTGDVMRDIDNIGRLVQTAADALDQASGKSSIDEAKIDEAMRALDVLFTIVQELEKGVK